VIFRIFKKFRLFEISKCLSDFIRFRYAYRSTQISQVQNPILKIVKNIKNRQKSTKIRENFRILAKIDQNPFGIEIYQFINISKSITLPVSIPHGPSPDLKNLWNRLLRQKWRSSEFRLKSTIMFSCTFSRFSYIFTIFTKLHEIWSNLPKKVGNTLIFDILPYFPVPFVSKIANFVKNR